MQILLRSLSWLTLVGCVPSVASGPAGDTVSTPDDTPAPDDTDPPEDSGEPEDDEDDDVEVIPDGQVTVSPSPPASLFSGSLTVSLTTEGDRGEIFACVGTPERVCRLEATDTLELDASGVVYAVAAIDGVDGPMTAIPYIQADSDVLDFTSNLPVLVAWSDEARDDLWTNTPMVLLTFQSASGRTDLTDPADLASRMRLRIRGSSSAGLDKKNYDIELWEADTDDDAPAALLGLPEDADWVLHAPSYFDDALIRNALGYQLSRDIGRYAPRTEFAELFILHRERTLRLSDYAGVYVVTEEIERGADRVDVARLDEGDVEWPEVSGGYVFKRDREGELGEGLYAGDGGGAFVFDVPIVPVDPELDDLERQQEAYLVSELDALGNALASETGTDPSTGRAWQDIVDVDTFIDHHILGVLVKNPDAFRLSGYFHKDREGQVRAGPIWDLDRTAGSIDSRARDPYQWDATNETTDTTPVFTYGWYAPMFADADFRLRYWARWQTLLAGPLSPEAVQTRIAEQRAVLAEAGPRNNARWGAPDWNGEQDAISAWYAARLSWISACIDRLEDPRTCAGAFAGE